LQNIYKTHKRVGKGSGKEKGRAKALQKGRMGIDGHRTRKK